MNPSSEKPTVLIAEKISQEGVDLLSKHCNVTFLPGWNHDELKENLPAFDALIVRSATKVTGDLISGADRLKVIGRAGVGVDNVDLAAATDKGIIVVNAPASTVQSVAEHVFALLFGLARNVARGDASMRRGEWIRSSLQGSELSGRTLVLLGVGRIGQAVGEAARAFGMHVVGYDPFVSKEKFARLEFEHALEIEDALRRADIVSLHMPLNDQTRGMISSEQISLMPKGSILVNTARGGLVDLDALNDAIESGHLAGAALDVYPVEPPPHHPLFERDDVLITPHLAASTSEAQTRAGVAVAEQVLAALTGGVITTAVNIPAIAPEDVEALQGFVPLTTKLAALAAQLAGQPLSHVRVSSKGDVSTYDVRMLGFSALIAMLSVSTDEPVTFVNARRIAERRGIAISEDTSPDAGDYRDLVEIAAAGSDGTVVVAGTTIGGDDRPWLTSAIGFRIEIELTPHMAFFLYADVPGMIGRVGTAFGDGGINIANMAVSRGAGTALMAVSFDESPPDVVIDALRSSGDFDRIVKVDI